MKTKILLTSFQIWLPHQKYNSSDQLLVEIQKLDYSRHFLLYFIINLPVDTELASKKVITEIEHIQPDVIICCGMAEKKDKPALESNASCQGDCLHTSIDLAELTKKLMVTEISHDAGKFVCEGLYYQILKYVQSQDMSIHCVFAHIPLLKYPNLDLILKDFHSMFFWLNSKFSKTIDK